MRRDYKVTSGDFIPHLVSETGPSVTHSVLWLHGLGADGYDFVNLVQELSLAKQTSSGMEISYRFIFPHAPSRPVTINGGMVMPAWYDITAMDYSGLSAENSVGLEASMKAIMQLLEAEVSKGIAAENLFLGGFSQGGALALEMVVRCDLRLGGVMGLSAYLPSFGDSPRISSSVKVPLYMAHGLHDPVVPCELGEKSYAYFKAQGYSVTWHTYPIAHEVSIQELKSLSQWLNTIITGS